MSKVLLNFSNHSLSKEAELVLLKRFDKIETIMFETIDFSSDMTKLIQTILKDVDSKLDGTVSITIIPPGHSTFAMLLVIYLFGLLGFFPDICMLDISDEGIFLPKNIFYINGNKLRFAGKSFRQELWKKG